MAVAITRTDLSAEELRGAAQRTKDSYQARRLLALARVLDGAARTAAARAAGMDRQTLRDWVHRYNAEGVEGLCDRARSGRPPRAARRFSWPSWRAWSRPAPMRRAMAWCAGAAPISGRRSRSVSVSITRSAMWGGC